MNFQMKRWKFQKQKIEKGMVSDMRIKYMVLFHNYLDDDFGYSVDGLYGEYDDKATAKSVERHLNKTQPDFMTFWVNEIESEN